MAYSLQKIAAAYDRPPSTTRDHIKQLIEQGKFKKESPGKQYSREEVSKLEKLMKFVFRDQK